jgi:hypothetical protein
VTLNVVHRHAVNPMPIPTEEPDEDEDGVLNYFMTPLRQIDPFWITYGLVGRTLEERVYTHVDIRDVGNIWPSLDRVSDIYEDTWHDSDPFTSTDRNRYMQSMMPTTPWSMVRYWRLDIRDYISWEITSHSRRYPGRKFAMTMIKKARNR